MNLALGALFAGATAIAFAPIFVRLSEVGPIATAFHRMLVASAVLVPWMLMKRSPAADAGGRPATPLLLALPGLFFAADLSAWHWSISYTTVANATLLANLAPIFVTLGAWLLFGERPRPAFVAAMLTALGGAVVLMGGSFGLSERHLAGDALGLLTAVFYGSYILSIARLRARHSTVTIMAWSSASASLALFPVTVAFGESLAIPTWSALGVLVGLGLVSHVAGQGLIAWALAHLSAPFGAVSLLWQPVAAALLAWLLLEEAPGALQMAGGIVVLAGIAMARRFSDGR